MSRSQKKAFDTSLVLLEFNITTGFSMITVYISTAFFIKNSACQNCAIYA